MILSEHLNNFEQGLINEKKTTDNFDKSNPVYMSLLEKADKVDIKLCKTSLDKTALYESALKEALNNEFPDKHWSEITDCDIRTTLLESGNDLDKTARKIVESFKVQEKKPAVKKTTGVLAENMRKKSLKEDWYHFSYLSGGNPYIAKDEKERDRILKKYKGRVEEVKPGFYEIDDIYDYSWKSIKRKQKDESLKEGEEVEYRKKYYSSIKPDGTGEAEYWEVEEPAHSKDWHLGGRNKKVLDKGEWQRRQGMKDESLKESAEWKYTLSCSDDLESAIDSGDLEEVVEALKGAYDELVDQELLDEGRRDKVVSALEQIDVYDDGAEATIEKKLDQFYNVCDKLGVKISFNESLEEDKSSKRINELFGIGKKKNGKDNSSSTSNKPLDKSTLISKLGKELNVDNQNLSIAFKFISNDKGMDALENAMKNGEYSKIKGWVQQSLMKMKDYNRIDSKLKSQDEQSKKKEQERQKSYNSKTWRGGHDPKAPTSGKYNRDGSWQYESLKEDTVKQGSSWVNKGKEGTHGKFKTKKDADAQRKAMFANGYKEGLKESEEGLKPWRGCRSIKFKWNGTQSDPDLIYKGYIFNYYDIEDALWDMFLEDNGLTEKEVYDGYNIKPEFEAQFDQYVCDMAPDYLEDVIAGGYFEGDSKSWHDRYNESKSSRKGEKLTERKDSPFDYERRLLSRLKSDCDYALGTCKDNGSSFEGVQKHFWAGNSGNQIAKMRELHQLSKDMDDIVTDSDIDTYEKKFRDWSKQEALTEASDGKSVENEFKNYRAFVANFSPVTIKKNGKQYYVFKKGDEDGEHWIQYGNKDYIDGWLYGAVQAKMKIVESAKSKGGKNPLTERNLTKSERYNRDMHRIFSDYRARLDRMKDYLRKNTEASDEEIETAYQNTGLGNNPNDLWGLLKKYGVHDAFFAQDGKKNESVKSKGSKKPLTEGTSNFWSMDDFPLLVFYTMDEALYLSDEYVGQELSDPKYDGMDEDQLEEIRDELDEKFWDELDVCVLDEEEVDSLKDDIDSFNSSMKDKYYYGDEMSGVNSLDGEEWDGVYPSVEIKPGYYSAAQLYVNVEPKHDVIQDYKFFIQEQVDEVNKFLEEMKKKYGLTDLDVAWHASNGETGYYKK